ncbi:MAG: hypothetical protein OES46_09655 [Gammaproteobacteria bacterium]|nr:hypothetical protein [Gammaproteobacteria bacterium]
MTGTVSTKRTSANTVPQLCERFLGWQCRLRQYAIRHAGGRPTPGMRPSVLVDGKELGQVTVLIIRRDPKDITTQFRHMVKRTHDPADRYDAALKTLAAAYYQKPLEFSDEMTALFEPDSEFVKTLLKAGVCTLAFEQYNQTYRVPCKVRTLRERSAAYQATYWHNSLFNPVMPSGVQVLAFRPDWRRAQVEPPIT